MRFLPAFGRDVLMEISLGVHESHSHEGDAESACPLAMVAGKNAQPAAVDGHGVMQSEFGRKIRNRQIVPLRVLARKPGAVPTHILLIRFEHRRVLTHECRIVREIGQPVRLHILKQFDGIVMRQTPQRRIDRFKELSSLRLPTPPEIKCQFRQPTETAGTRHRVTIAHNSSLSKTMDAECSKGLFITPTFPRCAKTYPFPSSGRREEKPRRRTNVLPA